MGQLGGIAARVLAVRGLGAVMVLGLLAGLTSVLTAPGASAATTSGFVRVAGADRYATAAAVADAAFPSGASIAVVATGASFPDALAADYLAGQVGGPVLLTEPTVLPAVTASSSPSWARAIVYLVGGTAAVSAGVAAQLGAMVGPNGKPLLVVRVFGNDRYSTAAAVANRVPKAQVGQVGGVPTALLATGTGFADALSGSAAAAGAHLPLLLTTPTSLSPVVLPTLKALGVTNVVILGGTGAVSSAVLSALTAAGITVLRIGGADRVATATLVAHWEVTTLGFSGTDVSVARGDDAGGGVDALSLGVLAGLGHQPLLLAASPTSLGSALTSWLTADTGLAGGTVAGGTGAVSAVVMTQLTGFLGGGTTGGGGGGGGGSGGGGGGGGGGGSPSGVAWAGAATPTKAIAPDGVAVDSHGNLYIADFRNHLVRRVDAATGATTIVAGNGTQGSSGDGGLATSAQLDGPTGLAVDTAGDLFIADTYNNRIRRLDATTGVITTVAQVNTPTGLALDSAGNLVTTALVSNQVQRVNLTSGVITTVAGTGTAGYSGDGGPATSAELSAPYGLAVDAAGDLFISDEMNNRVRRVDAVTGVITTVAGTGTFGYSGEGGPAASAQLANPIGLTIDASGNLLIDDTGNQRVRKLDVATGTITTVAGNGTTGFAGDGGPATSAEFARPFGVAVDAAGNLFIADIDNDRVRRVDAATGVISTEAGNGAVGFSGDGGPATDAQFFGPAGVAADSAGNLFIAETGNSRIRRVDAATGVVTTIAGTGVAGYAGDGGPAGNAQLNVPTAVVTDSAGDVYVADSVSNVVRRIDAATGVITTVAGNGTAGYAGDGGACHERRAEPPCRPRPGHQRQPVHRRLHQQPGTNGRRSHGCDHHRRRSYGDRSPLGRRGRLRRGSVHRRHRKQRRPAGGCQHPGSQHGGWHRHARVLGGRRPGHRCAARTPAGSGRRRDRDPLHR